MTSEIPENVLSQKVTTLSMVIAARHKIAAAMITTNVRSCVITRNIASFMFFVRSFFLCFGLSLISSR